MEGIYDNLQQLPAGWQRVKIGDEIEVIRGASPRPKGDPRYFGGSIPWIMISDVTKENGKFISKTRDHVTEEGAEKSRYLKAGTLILSNSATVCVPKILGVDGCIHDGFVAFPNLPKRFDILYLYYFFEFIRSRVIDAHRQGITQVNLNTTIVKNIQVPIAPPNEQKRIVAEIEKQFSRLDEAVANLKRVKVNLKRYKAAVLKAAVEGKLTEDWRKTHPDVEPASELLKRILAERRAKWKRKGKYKEPIAPDAANRPVLPQRWTLTTVGQLLAEPLCNGISVKGSDTPPGVRALRLSAMSDVGFDYSEVRYLPLSQDDVEGLWIAEGDFFISRGNGSLHLVGRGTPAQHLSEPTIFPDTMIRLRVGKEIRRSGWLRTVWPSRMIRSQIERRVKTTAGIYKIAQPEVEQITISLPPLSEQKRIVTEVEQRFSVVAEVEAEMAANLQRAERLQKSILQQAFTGQLASKLLT